MITTLDPGRAHRTLNVEDNIVFSKVWDKKGFPIDLKMCLIGQSGNAEMRAAAGIDDEPLTALRPVVLWLNGSAWHCSEKNRMLAELTYLADAGYLVAIAEYRGSEQAQFPAQLLDVKTAVRFLRAHAEKYRINPARIAVMGRSAGGHLAAWMAMDAPEYSGKGEWSRYSDQVTMAVDLFGPVDIPLCTKRNLARLDTPNARFRTLSQTPEGQLLGYRDNMSWEELERLGRSGSPIYRITEKTRPITILHGDADGVVPLEISQRFYISLVRAGLEKQSDLFIVHNGGHGTREFFQPETQQVILAQLRKYLGRAAD